MLRAFYGRLYLFQYDLVVVNNLVVLMKSWIKFPLLTLLCFSAGDMVSAGQAMAAPLAENAPTTTSGSGSLGVGAGFAPTPASAGGADSGAGGAGAAGGGGTVAGGGASASAGDIAASPAVAAAVSGAVSGSVTSLESGGAVSLPGGGSVTPSADAVDKVAEALKVNALKSAIFTKSDLTADVNVAAGSDSSAAVELAEQIALEASSAMPDVSLDMSQLTAAMESLSGLSTSPEKLPGAIDAVNDFVEGLSRPEMEALAQSPSYAMVQQILSNANAVL